MQWGKVYSNGSPQTFYYPIPFPHAVFTIYGERDGQGTAKDDNQADLSPQYIYINCFTINPNDAGYWFWMAIGY